MSKGVRWDTKTGVAGDGVISGGPAGSDLWLYGDEDGNGTVYINGVDHGGPDPHSGYALLAGRVGGQTLIGGPNSFDALVLRSNPDLNAEVIIQAQSLSLAGGDPVVITFETASVDPAYDVDGSVFYRSDALSLALLNLGTWLPQYMIPRIFDDFIYGSVAKMPWETVAIGTGTLAFSPGEINHAGILTFDGNDTDAGYAIHRGLNTVLLSEDLMACAMLMRFDSTAAAQHLSAGLGDSTTTTDDTDAIGFVISAAATIRGRCRAAGSETQTSTGFTFSTGTWYWLVWSGVGVSAGTAEIRFWVLAADGTLGADLGSVTSNVPTGAMGPNVRWRTTNNTDKTMDLGCYILAVHDQVTPLRKS